MGRTRENRNKKRGALVRGEIFARNDLDRRGVNAMDLLIEVYTLARDAYLSGRGVTEKGDSGSAYLAVAGKAAADMAKFAYPTMAAVQVHQVPDEDTKDQKSIDIKEARQALLDDPFAHEAITEAAKQVASNDLKDNDIYTFLPKGKASEPSSN